MDTCKYKAASSDKYTYQHLGESLITFITDHLEESHPQDDYHELLELVLIYLRGSPTHGVKFVATGAMHQARWMSKVIYTFKV